MEKLKVFIFLILIYINLESKDFVLFTQPKTATHLLIPILEKMTKKSCYWAPEYTKNVSPLVGSFEQASQHSENYLFSLGRKPWTRFGMDQVWKQTQKKNAFLHLHAPYSATMESYLNEKKSINLFIKRDPRDQIISLLNHYKYIHFNDKEIQLIQSENEQILALIRKESRIHTLHFMNWLYSPTCCVLDFEKLMGSHGGKATQDDALNELRKISNALELNISDSQLTKIYQESFGHSWSFFKGKVGVWKDYFDESHKTAIKEEIGDLLIQLGYENDLEW
jgi:hypothetical protein